MRFPKPPEALLDSLLPIFLPAPELKEWAFASFIHEGALLQNPDHDHLKDAEILFVWSSIAFKRGGNPVVGTAQMGQQQGTLGKRELVESVYRAWYGGDLPDFVITICAPYAAEAKPVAQCALVEHELYHCAQALDECGNPKFTDKNWPAWKIRGHDVEEFVGIAARYGAYSPELQALKFVLDRAPLVATAEIDAVCGCGAKLRIA